MTKLIEKFQEGKEFKYHYQNGDGVWFGTNSSAKMKELRNSGEYIPAVYDWKTREWIGRHDLDPVEITADRPTVLRDDRGMEWDHEGRDIINEAARSYRYNAYPNMSTYYDSRYFQNNRVPSARVGDIKGNRYVESQAPAVSDYYQVLLKQYPQLSGALKRRGWTPAQFSQYAMSGGFERDPREQENLDRANREVHSERRQKEEKFLKDVQERPDYKGLNYLMIGAAAFPALPIISESGLLSPVVGAGKDMLMHPARTALGFAGADIGGGAVDKTIQRTTGDENFGAMIGRITGTPELNGMWQFGNPGYFLGGFAGDMTHKIVRDGVNRFAPTVMSNMDNMFGNVLGLRPAYATVGGASADATESSIQMMGRKRNKGGNKGNNRPPKQKTPQEVPEPVEVKPVEEQQVSSPEPEPLNSEAAPVESKKPGLYERARDKARAKAEEMRTKSEARAEARAEERRIKAEEERAEAEARQQAEEAEAERIRQERADNHENNKEYEDFINNLKSSGSFKEQGKYWKIRNAKKYPKAKKELIQKFENDEVITPDDKNIRIIKGYQKNGVFDKSPQGIKEADEAAAKAMKSRRRHMWGDIIGVSIPSIGVGLGLREHNKPKEHLDGEGAQPTQNNNSAPVKTDTIPSIESIHIDTNALNSMIDLLGD